MSTAVFGAPEWRARSGRTIKPLEDGTITFQGSNGYLAPKTAMDAEEFFQAKRDKELGRWRVPEEPDYVVYPRFEDGYDFVLVVCERDGTQAGYDRHDFPMTDTDRWLTHRTAAARYFEAHPERKPWEDARNGEIWLMKDESHGATERAYLAVDGRFFVLPPKRPIDAGWEPAAFASNFTEGERFWPASAEEEEQFIAAMTPPVASSQAGLASIRGGL